MAGGRKLFQTTFNNGPANSLADGQAFPDDAAIGNHPALSGAAETNTLGYIYQGRPMDSVYRLASTLPHTADTLTLNFLAMGLNPDLAY